jgi:hypothetical protein
MPFDTNFGGRFGAGEFLSWTLVYFFQEFMMITTFSPEARTIFNH